MPYKDKNKANAYRRRKYAEDPIYKDRKKSQDRKFYYKDPQRRVPQKEARKLKVLSFYGRDGIAMCTWEDCTINDPDMLTIDHINNDGAEDRRLRKSHNIYLDLETLSYPEGFTTLCCNHQMKKELMRRRSLRGKKFRTTELNTNESRIALEVHNLDMGNNGAQLKDSATA